MSNQFVRYFTCDVCGARADCLQDRSPEGWAVAEIKYYNIPRATTSHKFDVCPACMIPDTHRDSEKPNCVAQFKKCFLAIKKRLSYKEGR